MTMTLNDALNKLSRCSNIQFGGAFEYLNDVDYMEDFNMEEEEAFPDIDLNQPCLVVEASAEAMDLPTSKGWSIEDIDSSQHEDDLADAYKPKGKYQVQYP